MNKPLIYLFDTTDKEHRYQITKRLVLAYQNDDRSDLELVTNDHEKPYFKDTNVHFNISHSNNLWVLAISSDEIGIDIEHIRPCLIDKIAERFFHHDEAVFLKHDPDAFFKLWSAKESYVKYHGWGIDEYFSKFTVVCDDKLSTQIDDVNLYHIDCDDQYALTLATRADEYQLIDMRVKYVELDQSNVIDARLLIKDYTEYLNVDLTFQAIEQELEQMMITYTPPKGYFVIAYIQEQAIGCVGIKPLSKDACELKRLFVRDAFRNLNIAHHLMELALAQAEELSYKAVYLDTLASLKAAVHLYDEMGFVRVSAYYDNPLPDVVYYKKDL